MIEIDGSTPGSEAQHESHSFIYDLRIDEGPADGYFIEVVRFSKTVVDEIEKRAGTILDRYVVHAVNVVREPPASRGEAAIDLLSVGAVIALYGSTAARVPNWVLRQLERLSWKCGRPAATADILRDALFRTFMKVPHREAAPRSPEELESVLNELPHLIEWLLCTGDLAEDSRCVANWASLLRTLPTKSACQWLEAAQELFEWFEPAAHEALGKYTAGVSKFIANRSSSSREDRFLRSKSPVEYHLAMVAAEIANEDMGRGFVRCLRKVVLLPACMRGVNARTCPGGQSGGLDVRCAGCDRMCGVNRITKVLSDSGADVYLQNCLRKSLPLIARWGREPRTGFVVVSCLANMRSIQLATRWARMTCQFLPLDFPGCQSHWRKEGIPTRLDEMELIRMVTGAIPGRI